MEYLGNGIMQDASLKEKKKTPYTLQNPTIISNYFKQKAVNYLVGKCFSISLQNH